MKVKRLIVLLLVVAATLSCFTIMASADNVARASGSFEITISPGKIKKTSTALPLEADDKVTIKASYSPFSATVDVGLVDEDQNFYYFTVSNGSVDKTIVVPVRGNYYFAVRNRGKNEISMSGYIDY